MDKKDTTKVNPSTVGRIARTFGLCLLASSVYGLSKQYVTLYRAVNDEELAIIQSTGTYGFNPNGSGKYFAQSEQGARNIRNSFPSNNTITRIQVPTSTLYAGTNFNDTGGAGPSVHYADTQLPVVYSTMTPIQILQE